MRTYNLVENAVPRLSCLVYQLPVVPNFTQNLRTSELFLKLNKPILLSIDESKVRALWRLIWVLHCLPVAGPDCPNTYVNYDTRKKKTKKNTISRKKVTSFSYRLKKNNKKKTTTTTTTKKTTTWVDISCDYFEPYFSFRRSNIENIVCYYLNPANEFLTATILWTNSAVTTRKLAKFTLPYFCYVSLKQ